MQALHIISTDPTKNIKKITTLESKVGAAYAELRQYLETLKTKKDEVAFKEHEAVITRMVYSLGQAALSDALSHYDVSCDMIEMEAQTYRRKHQAPKTYQTSLGPVTLTRHVYVNRKKGWPLYLPS